MAVRVEKEGKVWTVIHSRPQARNAKAREALGPQHINDLAAAKGFTEAVQIQDDFVEAEPDAPAPHQRGDGG